MYYIIQENVFREAHFSRLIKVLERIGLDYEVIQFTGEAEPEVQTQRNDVFCFGANKLTQLAQKMEWEPGSLNNHLHDYEVYSHPHYWKDHLLNADSIVQPLFDPIDFAAGPKFVRPTKDSKLFTGKVFSASEWEETLSRAKDSPYAEGAMIQVAAPKQLFQEIRCWIVGERVVTASTYKMGKEVVYREYLDLDGRQFAGRMLQLFQPAMAYVLDICLTDQGWKIVEVNCINSAGFYACDLQRLILSLEAYDQTQYWSY